MLKIWLAIACGFIIMVAGAIEMKVESDARFQIQRKIDDRVKKLEDQAKKPDQSDQSNRVHDLGRRTMAVGDQFVFDGTNLVRANAFNQNTTCGTMTSRELVVGDGR